MGGMGKGEERSRVNQKGSKFNLVGWLVFFNSRPLESKQEKGKKEGWMDEKGEGERKEGSKEVRK